MDFEHKFECHVRGVAQKMVKDGEIEVLAVVVKLRIMMDIGDEWGKILADLIDSRVLAYTEELTQALDSLPFSMVLNGLDVTFSAANETILTLRGAKLHKFVFDCRDAGITFVVQCETDGPTIGLLSELINTRIRVDITGEQAVLDLS